MSIYFITCRALNRVKIGHGSSAQRRMHNLQVGCPLPLKLEAVMPGGVETENEIHERFASLRTQGEWFAIDASIEALIAEHPIAPPPTRKAQPIVTELVSRARASNIKMAQVCREAGVAHSTVCRWLSGSNGALLDSVGKLTAALERIEARRAA